ncbi:MAG: hypothetical protein GTO63_29980 [Anaerolineae bacterium]|nr:hypothetical protein [Anaerolineae bacterium]NIN98940.1 hypothetical protein [Anaerolineae bacterium]
MEEAIKWGQITLTVNGDWHHRVCGIDTGYRKRWTSEPWRDIRLLRMLLVFWIGFSPTARVFDMLPWRQRV